MQTLLYFLLWAGFIFLMMRFGCGAHVTGHGHRHGGSKPEGTDLPGTHVRRTQPEEARDPVCGMTVETASAKSSVYDGGTYYFCSQSCREKFESSPASYARGESGEMTTMEQSHEHQH